MMGNDPAFAAADGGQPGDFLRQEPTARGAGMGGAMAAVVDDAGALVWNPAGLARLTKPEGDATHVVLFEDTSYDFVAGAWPGKKWGAFGGAFIRQASGGFQRRNGPNDAAVGFSISQQSLIGGWGKAFGPFDVGASLKSVKESIDTASGSGAGADAGAIYRHDGHFSVGLMIQNLLQPSVTFVSAAQKYPRAYDLSPAYLYEFNRDFKTLAAIRFLKVDGQSLAVAGGLELQYKRLAAARFGVQDKGLTSGVGLRFGNTSFDYAALLHELGVSHLITFTQRFGQTREELEETIRQGISELTAAEGARLAKAYQRRAETELADDRLAEAQHDLESAALLDPSNDEIHERIREVGEKWEAQLKRQMVDRAAQMAIREQEAGNLLAARSYWRNVLELDSQDPRAREQLSRIDGLLSADERRRLDKTRKEREEADAGQALIAAQALAARGSLREAVVGLESAAERIPDSPVLQDGLKGLKEQLRAFVEAKTAEADKLAAAGDYASALRAADAGLHEDPQDAGLQKRAASWRAQVRRTASPENRRKAEQLYYQAVELYLKGDFAGAGELAKQVLQLDPSSDAARALKDKVDAALRYAK